ncbi:MAG: TonB-dependent receptor [Bryobacterales bacterium]|nr:TonB-dependent receptor [Bryobacterales bacterium]
MLMIFFGLLRLSALAAHSAGGELYGAVRDAAKLPIAGAAVELTSEATGLSVRLTSSSSGAYHFLALPAGEYGLTAGSEGFATVRRSGIRLSDGGRIRLDVELPVGESVQTIEVAATSQLLQSWRGTVGFAIEQWSVPALPLDGRNFVALTALSPGVNLPAGSVLPRINGGRPRVSEYIYDGISVLQPEPGQVAYYPIVDSIEELRIETNGPSAEYGRSNGGIIIVHQKSGSNNLNGTLFGFFRHEALNARNLFATAAEKPRFRRDQYGFVLGGPIRKNKSFFFADWQGTRLNTGVVRISTVPGEAQKRGVFGEAVFDPFTTTRTGNSYSRLPFAGNTIPASRLDPAAILVASRYPAPTSAGRANNYTRRGRDSTAQDQFDLRFDRYWNARHKVFTRYAYLRDDSVPATPLADGSGTFSAPYLGHTLTRADSLSAEHTATLTPAAVNQLRLGFTRRGFRRSSLATGRPATAVAMIPNSPLTSFSDVVPTFDIAGLQQLGPPAICKAEFTTSVSEIADTFSAIGGRHSLKAGGDVRVQRLDVLQPANPTGNFQFTSVFTAALTAGGTPVAGTGNSFASFLAGPVTRFTIDAQRESLGPRATIGEAFLQDDWRATGHLTLNLGVRYTLNFPSTVAGDRGAVFDLGRQQLRYLGRDGFPRAARDLEGANFAPRIGVAYRLTHSSAMRAAYGLTWIEQAGITTPFTTPLFPFIQTLTQQTPDNLTPAFYLSEGPAVAPRPLTPDAGLGQGVFAVQRDNGSGYAQQWNFSLQKTLGGSWSVEGGYLGSKLTRLGAPDVNLNQLTVAQLAARTPISQRPYPRFQTVALYRNNTGHSTYHSFQSRVEKRFSRGLTFTAAYTFSRLIDDAGAVFDAAVLTGPAAAFQAADSFNKRLEKDVSTGNMPHIVSSGFVYEFRRSWQIAGILRAQSGAPLAVTQAANPNAFAGFGIQRPNRIADPRLPSAERTTGRYFDTAAFGEAPQFTIGNSSRNPVSGPGYRTADLTVGKWFAAGERLRIELRAEAFNIFNTPPLGNPNGSFGHPAFGAITTALDPRVAELVVKVRF